MRPRRIEDQNHKRGFSQMSTVVLSRMPLYSFFRKSLLRVGLIGSVSLLIGVLYYEFGSLAIKEAIRTISSWYALSMCFILQAQAGSGEALHAGVLQQLLHRIDSSYPAAAKTPVEARVSPIALPDARGESRVALPVGGGVVGDAGERRGDRAVERITAAVPVPVLSAAVGSLD